MQRFPGLSRRRFGAAALGVIVAGVPAGAGLAKGMTMAQETMPAVLEGYVAALNAHDPEAAAGAYREDAVVEQAVLHGNMFTGREEIAGWVGDNLAGLPDLRVTVGSVTQQDDRLVWEWTYAGAYTGQFPGAPEGSGQPVELRGVSVMTLDGDLIARETLYYDNQSFLTQIGVEGGATPAS
jgi:steroid delta-isomerase-like uncharacterized protein